MCYISVHSIVNGLPVDTWLGVVRGLAKGIPLFKRERVVVEDIIDPVGPIGHRQLGAFLVVPC